MTRFKPALATTFGPVSTQARSASGKRDSSAQRQTAQNRLQARNGLRGDRDAAARARQLRASRPSPGNLAVRMNAWWRTQSLSNRSPCVNFPDKRETTGNFAQSAGNAAQGCVKNALSSDAYPLNSLRALTGNFVVRSGKRAAKSGKQPRPSEALESIRVPVVTVRPPGWDRPSSTDADRLDIVRAIEFLARAKVAPGSD